MPTLEKVRELTGAAVLDSKVGGLFYRVNCRRVSAGMYELSYGRGRGKLTANVVTDLQHTGKWRLEIPGRDPVARLGLRMAKDRFCLWATKAYGEPLTNRATADAGVDMDDRVNTQPEPPPGPAAPAFHDELDNVSDACSLSHLLGVYGPENLKRFIDEGRPLLQIRGGRRHG